MDNCFDEKAAQRIREHVYDFYLSHKRLFPWRSDITPYRIFVSEIMLQQTQTARVVDKFLVWTERFPSFQALADASFEQVLSAWSGLGYNRRALWIHQAAQEICRVYNGVLPNDPEQLVQLKGIGKNTACSIVAFAYNIPTIFIETNIRTVFLHLLFSDAEKKVSDQELMPFIAAALDHEHPREWYYALMDFGVHLKKTLPNPSRKSAHHGVQSKFEGSKRQLRGKVLRLLLEKKKIEQSVLVEFFQDHRIESVLQDLISDGLIIERSGVLEI